MCIQCLWSPEEGVGAPGTLIDGYELSCGFWEKNPGPLEVKPVFLTARPSLKSEILFKST